MQRQGVNHVACWRRHLLRHYVAAKNAAARPKGALQNLKSGFVDLLVLD